MVMERNLVKVGNREVRKRYIGNKLIFEDLGDKTEIISGEEIYTDKADDSVVHAEVDGKSVGGGSGKNLITNDPKYWEIGSLNANNGHNHPSEETLRSPYIELKKGTYTLSISNNIGSYSSLAHYVYTYDKNKGGISGLYWSTSTKKTIMITEDGQFIRILVRPNPRIKVSLNDVGTMFNIQLEEGSIATEYEPPAPSPDYPIEIHSFNDFDVVSSVGKRNLLVGRQNGNYRLDSNNNNTNPIIYKSYEDYDSVTLTDGHQLSTYSFELFTLEKGKEYTGSMYVYSPVKLDLSVISYRGNVWTTVPANTWTRLSKTFIGTGERQRIASLYSKTAAALNHEIFYNRIKLEEGKSSRYTPAPEDITENDNHLLIDKINLTFSEPLRSVGDVKDRLFRDDSDGLWKIERNIGEEILDSSSRFTRFSPDYDTDLTTNRSFYPYKIMHYNTRNTRTTHFIRDQGGALWFSNRVAHISNNNDQFHINFPNDLLGILPEDDLNTRNSKIRAWLEGEKSKETPLKIEYELEAPTIETLDQELQDKLNNLRSFQDSNYVYTTVSENLKPTLHTTFKSKGWYDYYKKTLLK